MPLSGTNAGHVCHNHRFTSGPLPRETQSTLPSRIKNLANYGSMVERPANNERGVFSSPRKRLISLGRLICIYAAIPESVLNTVFF